MSKSRFTCREYWTTRHRLLDFPENDPIPDLSEQTYKSRFRPVRRQLTTRRRSAGSMRLLTVAGGCDQILVPSRRTVDMPIVVVNKAIDDLVAVDLA